MSNLTAKHCLYTRAKVIGAIMVKYCPKCTYRHSCTMEDKKDLYSQRDIKGATQAAWCSTFKPY